MKKGLFQVQRFEGADTVLVGAKIPVEIVERLINASYKLRKSRSLIIREAIEKYLKEIER